MTATHKNFLKTTISAVAGSGLGALTVSTASSGYRTFGAGDDGLTFDGVTISEGTAWEVRDGCVYTHSGTSLSRGTLMDSSTGSAIAFTSAAVVQQGGTAEFAARLEQAALNQVAASPTTADVTGVVGTLHVLDISGLTASRNFILPAVAAVNDRVGVFITTGDDTYGLILKADTGDDIIADNSTFTAAEWTRLIMKGEAVFFRCTVANSTWIVEYDGRLKTTSVAISDAATTQTLTRNSATKITTALATEQSDPSGEWDHTNKKFVARRAGVFEFTAYCQMSGIALDKAVLGLIYKNGSPIINGTVTYSAVAGGAPAAITNGKIPLAVGDEVEFYFYHEDAATNRATFAGVGRVFFNGTFMGGA